MKEIKHILYVTGHFQICICITIAFNNNGDTYLQIYSADSRVSASIDFDLLVLRKMLFIIVKKYIFLVLQFFKIRAEYRIHQMRPFIIL